MRAHPIRLPAIPFVAWLLLLLTAAGCPPAPSPVGAPCDLGVSTPGGDGVTISSPALECAGGLCLQVGTGPALCSAGCGSDDDCGTDASCPGTFKCTAATSVGMYACRRLCICRDLLPAPPSCELEF